MPATCLPACLPAAKQKSLHALALVPSSEQDADALSAIPDGSTPSPYDDSLHQQQGKKRQQPMEVRLGMVYTGLQ
jgi:hypothetical protein